MNKIAIAFCIDTTYTQHLGVAIASLLKHNSAKDVNIYVASSPLPAEEIEKIASIGKIFGSEIHFRQIQQERVAGFKQFMHLSHAAYYRILLADILPELSKIIYLDCDLVVETNLLELWNTDLSDAGVAGVDEENPAQTSWINLDSDFYINSGVLVLNLDFWRKHNTTAKCLTWLEEHPEKNILCDQDAINSVLKGEKKRIPLKWNLNPVPYDDINMLSAFPDRILHFGGPLKPWHKCYDFTLQKIYKKYLQLTPWIDGFSLKEPKNPTQACIIGNQYFESQDYFKACHYYQIAIEMRISRTLLESKLHLDCINGGHRHFNSNDYFSACEHYRSCLESWGFMIDYHVNIYLTGTILDEMY